MTHFSRSLSKASVSRCPLKETKRFKTKRPLKTAFSPGSVFGRLSAHDRQTS